MTVSVDVLKKKLLEISHLGSLLALANWDQEVNLPKKAADGRAAAIARLSGIVHKEFTSIDSDGLLSSLKKQADEGKIKGEDAVVVNETWRSFERLSKLPEEFVREYAELTSKAQGIWAEARHKNDFALFAPWLAKIVDFKRREAEYFGYEDSPYDALLDVYEPSMTAKEVSRILNDLKVFLVPFLKKILASEHQPDAKLLSGVFPIDSQLALNQLIAEELGFDFEAGRLDKSTHPFTSGFHPHDVRITTRFKESDLFHAIGSTIHEVGHGLYEQGLPHDHFGTPLAESISLGIHESQSRMWENVVGKSRAFWNHFYPTLVKAFPEPFAKVPTEDFYRAINRVTPSLIRTEADEVTYNLHIIIRFEIEKELIEGSIEVADLPKIWNAKMKEYLGVDVPSDTLGVLQDVHWSCGLFGYFPTYTLGNLYSAQFYSVMIRDIPDIEEKIAQGEFKSILEWLRKHIHSKGKMHTATDLVQKISGELLSSAYFTEYLQKKYGDIYKINS